MSALDGNSCDACGVDLECVDCLIIGVPAYCSAECANGKGVSEEAVCAHATDNDADEFGDE